MLNLIDHYYNGEKLYAKCIEPLLNKHELTYTEFNILMFLYNNQKYDTAAQIVKYRHLAKSHVSTSVKSLKEKGYLVSFKKEKDQKTIHLRLTTEVIPICEEGYKSQIIYKETLTEGFSKDEIKQLINFVNRVDKNIEDNLKD